MRYENGEGAASAERSGGAGARLSRALLRFSFICAFISLALICLNAFPYGPVKALYPERPSYLIAMAGMIAYFLSLRWLAEVRRHAALVLVLAAFLLYGAAVSVHGALELDKPGLLAFTLISFVQRKAAPLLYALWFAFLLSPLPEREAKRFFIGALLVMFVPNALHMLLEILANAGWARAMDFLLALNPWFRLENVSHGSWPPPFYLDRVRGLFAEPSHLAYALTPLLAFFFFRLRANLFFILPILLIGFSYLYKIPNITGLLSFGFLAAAFAAHAVSRRAPRRAPAILGALLLAVVCLGGALAYQHRDGFTVFEREWNEASRIVEYCREADTREGVTPPELESVKPSRFFTRLVCQRMELDIAARHPFGTGFYLSGLYWKPMAVWRSRPEELFVYVDDALKRPVPVIPQLCEYTALVSELGLPGLLLFFALCALIARPAWRRHKKERDDFALYMLFALAAFGLTLLSIALKSGFILYYFLGFLYAIGQDRTVQPADRTWKNLRP